MTHEEQPRIEETESSRRAFMKSAGKLAIYTAPAMLVLMKPATAEIAKSPGIPNGKPVKKLPL